MANNPHVLIAGAGIGGLTAALVARVMEGAAHLDVPLVVDTGHAHSWADAQ